MLKTGSAIFYLFTQGYSYIPLSTRAYFQISVCMMITRSIFQGKQEGGKCVKLLKWSSQYKIDSGLISEFKSHLCRAFIVWLWASIPHL